MSIIELFKRKRSAPVARERLQIILAHERAAVGSNSDLVVTLREEILAVIAKHMTIERDKVNVKMDRNQDVSMLEVEVELPLKDQDGNTVRLAANA